ncbi:hypothetical protein K1719_031209 [Acacia pycnantha]|nr:hypothetical protein K1719_031209 [Acacia pycnantha]
MPPHSPMPLHRNCRRNGHNQAARGRPGRRIQHEDRGKHRSRRRKPRRDTVNGTCLRVTQFDPNVSDFTVGLSSETIRKTSLMELDPGGDSFDGPRRRFLMGESESRDGTSLTVVDVFDEEGCFHFMLVAYIQQNVVIPLKKVGQKVNLKVDIIGKYVERLLSTGFVDSIKNSWQTVR